MIAMLLSTGFSTVSHAASSKASVSVSKSSLKVGDTVTVTVTVSCDSAIGSYSMGVTYNPAVIEYVSGSGSGGGGTVNIAGYGDGSATSSSATLTFKAVGNGSSSISTAGGEVYNWNEEAAALSGGSASVSVTTATSSGGGSTSGGNTSGGGSTTADDSGESDVSGNAKLASLQISPGSLSPAFSANTTKYTTKVEMDVTKLVVSATPADSGAKVSVSGNNNLKDGSNKVTITVTAASGATKSYVINVQKGDTTEEDTEEEPTEVVVDIDGKQYTFADSEEGLIVPKDFTLCEGKYGEDTVLAFEAPNGKFKVVCLLDGTAAQYWYLLDEQLNKLLPYIEYQANVNRYVILEAGSDIVVPEGYSKIDYDIDGLPVVAYSDGNEEEFVLVYAMTVYGEPGFYLYDSKEATFQRYIEKTVTTEEATEAVAKEPEKDNSKMSIKDIVMYVACGLALLFFVMTILLAIQIKDKRLKTGNIVDNIEDDSKDDGEIRDDF